MNLQEMAKNFVFDMLFDDDRFLFNLPNSDLMSSFKYHVNDIAGGSSDDHIANHWSDIESFKLFKKEWFDARQKENDMFVLGLVSMAHKMWVNDLKKDKEAYSQALRSKDGLPKLNDIYDCVNSHLKNAE